jgi:hypothetical protein
MAITSPTRSPQTSSPLLHGRFSMLTCLFAGGAIITAETCIDVMMFSNIDMPVRSSMVAILQQLGMNPVYGYGLYYWLPPVLISFVLGYRLRRNGLMYSLLGIFAFLLLIHNFRGISTRHNVFEIADLIRSGGWKGLPSPFFWDVSYVFFAAFGALLGWRLKSRLTQNTDPPEVITLGVKATLLCGGLCAAAGLVEAVVTFLFAHRADVYYLLPQQTHGYAVLAYGFLILGTVLWRDKLEGYEII